MGFPFRPFVKRIFQSVNSSRGTKPPKRKFYPRLMLEALEERTLLTATLNISVLGNLTYTATPGVVNNLTVSVTPGTPDRYTFHDTGETGILVTGGINVTGNAQRGSRNGDLSG